MKSYSRVKIAHIIQAVVDKEVTLDEAFLAHDVSSHAEVSFIKACCYGLCRWYFPLAATADALLSRPLREKDRDIYFLLLAGLYQLKYSHVAPHAAVSETVNAVQAMGKPWAKNLLNACLRNFQRHPVCVTDDDLAHPSWLVKHLQRAWPEHWSAILNANNTQAPMTLRDHLKVRLLDKPIEVTKIPGFLEGKVSVQDEVSQYAVPLLGVQANMRVLDACAAPGGKTGHLMELEPTIALTALDISETRLIKVEENLKRLGCLERVKLIACDAREVEQWWDGELFDRILLDAPCSGTGVIRRHPDIKLLRAEEDIAEFQVRQLALINALWPLLASGGKLLYTTCSVLPEENEVVIQRLNVDDMAIEPILLPIGMAQTYGWQCFPQINGHDGFYYCLLRKR